MSDVVQFPQNKKPLNKKLQSVLEGDFAGIKQEARAFLTQPDLLPPQPGITKEEYREKTMGWVKKMAEAGFAQIGFDSKHGGGGDPRKSMNFVEMIAHHDLSFMVKQGVNFGLFGLGIQNLGTAKHHEKYLSDIMNGKLCGGFAMTEIAGGSDVQSVKTEAVYDHATRSFTLNTPTDDARKAFIGNAAKHGEMMIVFAQLKMSKDAESEGVHAFLVPVRDKAGKTLPGITIDDCGEKIGLNGVDNAYLRFDQVKIPHEAMLDRFATVNDKGQYHSDIPKKTARFFKMIGTLVTGRVALAAASLSGAKSALTAAITYADTREVFGSNLLDKQATQKRLLPPLADAYAMHFATRLLIDKYAGNAPDLETMAAALKTRSSDSAIRTIDEARLVSGGAGYMADTRYGRFRDDVDVFRTFEGDNTVLRLLVARNRLSEVRKQFNNVSGVKKTAKMASLAIDNATSKFSLSKGRTRTSHLLDPEFQADMFSKRENAMLYDLSRKIAKAAKQPGGAERAVEKSQNDMIAYSDAYAEVVMLSEFTKAVSQQKDPETKAVLKDLCDLFAVSTMLKHATWYLENGYMKPAKTKALAETAETLCEKLRPNAVALVQAFAIPDALLSVPKPTVAAAVVPPKKKAGGPQPGC
jgi:acyl-CoA oxidase